MKIGLILFVAVVIVGNSFSQNIDPPSPGKSVVYFVRPSALGFAINFSYFDSTKLIGRFNAGKYVRYECEPGKHLFWARSENRDFMTADLLPDKVYFLEGQPRMGALKAGVNLAQIDPSNPKEMKRVLKLIGKKSPESFDAARLTDDSADLQDAIARGMEKYNSDKAKGKSVQSLDRSKYYNKP